MSTINRKFFFDHARLALFDGALKPSQVDGLNIILDYWESKHAAADDRWLAYLLATAHHETNRTMQPIKELGGTAYFTRRYDPLPDGQNPAVAKRLGNTVRGDGARFCGRGYVQVTGRNNYTTWAKRLALDLVGDPDQAMKAAVAVQILVEGSIGGSFTGKKLGDYLHGAVSDWKNARRVINGTDKNELIASYATKYYGAVSYTA